MITFMIEIEVIVSSFKQYLSRIVSTTVLSVVVSFFGGRVPIHGEDEKFSIILRKRIKILMNRSFELWYNPFNHIREKFMEPSYRR